MVRVQLMLAALTIALSLPAESVAADMYRWVDARGVVNYSNVPPPAAAKAKRIADAEPTVSVIPPPERPPEARREAREAALERRIEQLEYELAQLRRAAAQPPAYAPYPAPPAVSYADYRAPIVYPVPVFPVRAVRPHPPGIRFGHFKHGHPHAARFGQRHSFPEARGARLNVRIDR